MMKLVILGGGFCGALVAKIMEGERGFETTLIDNKDRFLFTPSLPKCLFKPTYPDRITIPFQQFLTTTRIIEDTVVTITPTELRTRHETIAFDYLLISTGSAYPIPLVNTDTIHVLKTLQDAQMISARLESARRVLIVGGGHLGVEIAAEIITNTPEKEVTIVHSHAHLLDGEPARLRKYVRALFKRLGVTVYNQERILDHSTGKFITSTGRVLEADLGIWCAGIGFEPPPMEGFGPTVLSPKKMLNVNDFLQLQGYPNIFVGGDLVNIKEAKTGQNAERHAYVIAANLRRGRTGGSLIPYRPKRTIVILSLGDQLGVMSYNNHALMGALPGVMKHLVERWILSQYR